jgi:hypothetical protein
MDWIDLAQDRNQWRPLGNTAMNLRVPKNVGKLSNCTTGGFSRSAQLHVSSFPAGRKDFFLSSTASRPSPGPTQPPFRWAPAALSPDVKRVEGGGGTKLTTLLHLVPRSRMVDDGANTSLPKGLHGMVLN